MCILYIIYDVVNIVFFSFFYFPFFGQTMMLNSQPLTIYPIVREYLNKCVFKDAL